MLVNRFTSASDRLVSALIELLHTQLIPHPDTTHPVVRMVLMVPVWCHMCWQVRSAGQISQVG